MILIGYDGSPDAQSAIARAGELLPGRAAVVLTVWEQLVETLARVGAGMPMGELDFETVDRSVEDEARRTAEAGAEQARDAGLEAQARIRVRDGSIGGCILAEAVDMEAEAIVLGSRGLTGVKSLLLGSVSHAVLQHADRPVLVVPSPEVVAARTAGRR